MRIKYSTYLALECLYSMLLFLFNFERYERDESTRAAGAVLVLVLVPLLLLLPLLLARCVYIVFASK